MELVPILSTIILVGTIATFILAVAAYILYKVRERRAHEDSAGTPQYVREPHVLVAPQQATLGVPVQQAPSTNVYVSPRVAAQPAQVKVAPQAPPAQQLASEPQNSLFWEYTDEGFVPVQPDDAPQSESKEGKKDDEGFAWL
jgi:heme/copper-type cytochrome/quinol oxidase subunit 2